jgi:hypothetical protein
VNAGPAIGAVHLTSRMRLAGRARRNRSRCIVAVPVAAGPAEARQDRPCRAGRVSVLLQVTAVLGDCGMPVADGARSSGIRTPDQRLRVFVSSTLEELAAERGAARAAIEQLRLAPVMFESGARAHPPQAVYRAYLEQSDVFVGIYWQRYGWVGPGMTISGLEDELRLAAGMPRLLYVKVPAPGMEPGLRRMLEAIRAEGAASYKTFTDAAELRELVASDLATMLAERFGGRDRAARWPEIPSPVTALVGREADVAEVTRMLTAPGARLVVLTGPAAPAKPGWRWP